MSSGRNKAWDWVVAYLVPAWAYRLYKRMRYGKVKA